MDPEDAVLIRKALDDAGDVAVNYDLDCEIHCHTTRMFHRKMVFSPDGARLIGMVLVGDIRNAGLYRHINHSSLPSLGSYDPVRIFIGI